MEKSREFINHSQLKRKDNVQSKSQGPLKLAYSIMNLNTRCHTCKGRAKQERAIFIMNWKIPIISLSLSLSLSLFTFFFLSLFLCAQ